MRRALALLALFPALSVYSFGQSIMATEPVTTSPNPPVLNIRPAEPPTGNDNPCVVALMRKGFDDTIILAKIKASNWTFKLTDEDMASLLLQGLSSRVVAAMVDSNNIVAT